MMWDQTVNSVSFKPRYFQLNSSVSIKELQVKFHSPNQVPVQNKIQRVWLHLLPETCLEAALSKSTDWTTAKMMAPTLK